MSSSQCPQCGPFPQKSIQYDHEYHTSPSLQRLRSSNLQATDEEIAHVQTTFLSDIHRDRISLEARLAALSRVVASMKEECDALRTLEDKYQGLVSARRAMPCELWPDIFLYARSNDEDFVCMRPSGIIWQLSHVCKAWRDVALSLNSFWSRITINFYDTYASKHRGSDKMVYVLPLVLGRADLLDISIHYATYPLYSVAVRDRVLDIVLTESHRWRSAHLQDPKGDGFFGFFATLYAPIRGRLPQLRSLTFDTVVNLKGDKVRLFEDCPLLTKVVLLGGGVSLPVAQIRELQIGIAPYLAWFKGITRASLELISQCPLVEGLHISIPEDDNVQAIITTPNLHKLETDSGHVIDKLVTPLLREAMLFDTSAHISHVLQSFWQLLRRSDCMRTFSSLKIVGGLLRRDHAIGSCPLLSILVETTWLTVLELDLSTGYNAGYAIWEMRHVAELMRALQVTPHNNNAILLPCLSSMTIAMRHSGNHMQEMPLLAPDGSDGSWGNFVAMLKARWEGAEALGLTRLHTFHVAVTNEVWENPQWEYAVNRIPASGRLMSCEECTILDELVGAGMNLDIQFTLDDINRSRPCVQLLKVPAHSAS